MPKLPTRPPDGLLAAFRASENVSDLGAITDDEGFDAETIRVLGSWRHIDNSWFAPKRPCPTPGMPTAAAWEWLVSGWDIDYRAVARGADVSESTARKKMGVLIANRLVYPDGSMAKAALAALTSHVAKRLRGGSGKRKPPDESN